MMAVIYGLLSAVSWGAGDFAGGLGSRRTGALRTVMLAEMWGLLLLFISLFFITRPSLNWEDLAWSAVAGALGALGLVFLYKAMTKDQMSIAAAVSSVTSAALPVIAAVVLEGLPGHYTLMGIFLALLAIWLVSQGSGGKLSSLNLKVLGLPLVSGLCFGIYFILIHKSGQQDFVLPLISARMAGSLSLGMFTVVSRQSWLPTLSAWPYILLAGILDVGGNIFFILSGQVGRLDTAAVLGSLYSGVTVILALVFLKEKITRTQGIGFLAALGAVILLTIQA